MPQFFWRRYGKPLESWSREIVGAPAELRTVPFWMKVRGILYFVCALLVKYPPCVLLNLVVHKSYVDLYSEIHSTIQNTFLVDDSFSSM